MGVIAKGPSAQRRRPHRAYLGVQHTVNSTNHIKMAGRLGIGVTLGVSCILQLLHTQLSAAAPVFGRPAYKIWLGNGCFWERQYAYAMLEMNATGPFKRSNASVTSVVGYAGAKGTGKDGLVCYDTGKSNDYGTLGYAEAVGVQLDAGHEESQFGALVDNFFLSFTPTSTGFMRPDLPPNLPFGDVGAPYRTVLGIPGGVRGPLFKVLSGRNTPRGPYNMTMSLKEDASGNMTQDEDNTVWVMDSNKFPFYQGEQYPQFHSNFFANPQQPAKYPDWYLKDLWTLQIKLGNLPKTGCPTASCPPGPTGPPVPCHW